MIDYHFPSGMTSAHYEARLRKQENRKATIKRVLIIVSQVAVAAAILLFLWAGVWVLYFAFPGLFPMMPQTF